MSRNFWTLHQSSALKHLVNELVAERFARPPRSTPDKEHSGIRTNLLHGTFWFGTPVGLLNESSSSVEAAAKPSEAAVTGVPTPLSLLGILNNARCAAAHRCNDRSPPPLERAFHCGAQRVGGINVDTYVICSAALSTFQSLGRHQPICMHIIYYSQNRE